MSFDRWGNACEPLNSLNTKQGSVICISFDANDYIFPGTGKGILNQLIMVKIGLPFHRSVRGRLMQLQ